LDYTYLSVVTKTFTQLNAIKLLGVHEVGSVELKADGDLELRFFSGESANQGDTHEFETAYNFAESVSQFTAFGLPDSYSIDPDTGVISGTSTNDDVGEYTVTVSALGTSGESLSATVLLVINNINDSPVLLSAENDYAVDRGQIHSFDVSGRFDDIDFNVPNPSEVLTFSAEGLPASYLIDPNTGVV